MAYVDGDLGRKIQALMDKSDNQYNDGQYIEAIHSLEEAWELLPSEKNEYDESFLIVWGILTTAIQAKNVDAMNKWVDKIFDADPARVDSGEREMWAGRVAYESGNLDQAKEYFTIANKKSRGRCFGNKDMEYKKFFKNS